MRIDGFPRRLGDLAAIQTGPFGSQLHASDYEERGTPIITVEHLGDNEIVHENLPLVGNADRARLIKYSLQTGDIVFSRVGAIDRRAYVSDTENGWLFSGRLLRVRPFLETTDGKFLSHLLGLRSTVQWILNHSVGSTMACLNTGILQAVPMHVPPLPEQCYIASILDNIDGAIRKTEQIISKLKHVKKGLLHDLLSRGLDDNGEVRDPERHPGQFKDSVIGRIPRGWDVRLAREICLVITKGTTPPAASFRTSERSVRYLRVDNLTFSGALDLSPPALFIDRRTHETALARSQVQQDDVLMNIVGPPLGKVSVVPEASHAWNVNQAIAIFRVAKGVLPTFLATWLLIGATTWFRRNAKQTSGQVNLTLEMCAALPVPVPGELEQRGLLTVLASIDSRLAEEHAALNKYRLLKHGLMEDLLTGRVRVTKLLEG